MAPTRYTLEMLGRADMDEFIKGLKWFTLNEDYKKALSVLALVNIPEDTYVYLFTEFVIRYESSSSDGFKDKILGFLTEYSRLGLLRYIKNDADGILARIMGYERPEGYRCVRIFMDVGLVHDPDVLARCLCEYEGDNPAKNVWYDLVNRESSDASGYKNVYNHVEYVFWYTMGDGHWMVSWLIDLDPDTLIGKCVKDYVQNSWKSILCFDQVLGQFLVISLMRFMYLKKQINYIFRHFPFLEDEIKLWVKPRLGINWYSLLHKIMSEESYYPNIITEVIDFSYRMDLMPKKEMECFIRNKYKHVEFTHSSAYPVFVKQFPVDDEFLENVIIHHFFFHCMNRNCQRHSVDTSMSFMLMHYRSVVNYMTKVTNVLETYGNPSEVVRFYMFRYFPNMKTNDDANFSMLPPSDRIAFLSQWLPGIENISTGEVNMELCEFKLSDFVVHWTTFHSFLFTCLQDYTLKMKNRDEFRAIEELMIHIPSRRFMLEKDNPWECHGYVNLPGSVWEHIANFIPGINIDFYRTLHHFLSTTNNFLWAQLRASMH